MTNLEKLQQFTQRLDNIDNSLSTILCAIDRELNSLTANHNQSELKRPFILTSQVSFSAVESIEELDHIIKSCYSKEGGVELQSKMECGHLVSYLTKYSGMVGDKDFAFGVFYRCFILTKIIDLSIAQYNLKNSLKATGWLDSENAQGVIQDLCFYLKMSVVHEMKLGDIVTQLIDWSLQGVCEKSRLLLLDCAMALAFKQPECINWSQFCYCFLTLTQANILSQNDMEKTKLLVQHKQDKNETALSTPDSILDKFLKICSLSLASYPIQAVEEGNTALSVNSFSEQMLCSNVFLMFSSMIESEEFLETLERNTDAKNQSIVNSMLERVCNKKETDQIIDLAHKNSSQLEQTIINFTFHCSALVHNAQMLELSVKWHKKNSKQSIMQCWLDNPRFSFLIRQLLSDQPQSVSETLRQKWCDVFLHSLASEFTTQDAIQRLSRLLYGRLYDKDDMSESESDVQSKIFLANTVNINHIQTLCGSADTDQLNSNTFKKVAFLYLKKFKNQKAFWAVDYALLSQNSCLLSFFETPKFKSILNSRAREVVANVKSLEDNEANKFFNSSMQKFWLQEIVPSNEDLQNSQIKKTINKI